MSQTNEEPQVSSVELSSQLTRFAVHVCAEAMFTVAPDGQILDANATACERLEYTRDELLTMTIADIDPHYPAEMWPQHFDELRRNGKMRFETQHSSKSGRLIDVEVSVAFFEFEGNEYCVSSVRDITQSKRADQMVQLQNEVLAKVALTTGELSDTLNELCLHVQAMVPGAFATVMRVDPNDGLLRFEAGPILTDELRQAFEPLTPGDTGGSCGASANLRRPVIVEDTRCSPYWASLQHIVKKYGLLACWSLPILDERDQVLGTFAISHATTAKPTHDHLQILETASHLASIAMRRQLVEEELRSAHENLAHISRLNMMGEMASSFAHELNQPLAAIVNHAYVLEKRANESNVSNDLSDHVRQIREQAVRAGEIVKSVRGMAKRSGPSNRRVDLNDLVRKSLAIVAPELRQMSVSAQIKLSDEIPEIQADEIQIQQIMVNLVRNAIEAMSTTDRVMRSISISTECNGKGRISLNVADSGPGLCDDELETIFEPFQTSKPDGMGMGLSICRSIAERHGGQLDAESNEDNGALFRLSLPIESELE